MDENYLFTEHINQRYQDLRGVYNDVFITSALRKLNNYEIDYILLSLHNQYDNEIRDLKISDGECIKEIYQSSRDEDGKRTRIYEVVCELS